MTEVLSKPADQIGIDDIKALITSKVPEGEQIEFKESLPAKKQPLDPWITGKDEIGDPAKNKILEEVVAFANAHGGALLLGSKSPILNRRLPPKYHRSHDARTWLNV